MKKLLSIILACAMIMSLFCVVPASAADYYSNYELPYLFSDFEGNKTIFPGAGIVEDATRGSVAKASTTAKSGGDLEVCSKAVGYTDGHINGAFLAGDQLTVSFWVKLSKPLTEGARVRLLFWDNAETPTGQVSAYAMIPDHTSTDWQYVQQTTSMPAYTFGKIQFRMGLNDNNKAADETYAVDYLIDDLEIKVEHGTAITSHISDSASAWITYFDADKNGFGTDNMVTMVGPSGVELRARRWQGATSMAGTAQQVLVAGAGGQSMTLSLGDELRISGWVHIDKVCASTPYYVFYAGQNWAVPLENKVGWQYMDHTFVNDSYSGKTSMCYAIGTNGTYVMNQSSIVKATDGTFPVFSIFALNVNFKSADKGLVSARTTASWSRDGKDTGYYWSSNYFNKEYNYSTTGPDGSTIGVQKLTFNVNIQGADAALPGGGRKYADFLEGDDVIISMWLKTPVALKEGAALRFSHSEGSYNKETNILIPIASTTEWQKIEGTYAIGTDISAKASGQFCIGVLASSQTVDGTPVVLYLDDISVKLGKEAKVTKVPAVNAGGSATLSGSGAVTAEYGITLNSAAVAEANDKSVYKVVGATSGRVYATSYSKTDITAPVDVDESLLLEIVPVTIEGYIGVPATIAIIDLSAFNGIEILSADIGYAEISTDTAIENAKLIWVGYTDDTEHSCIEMTGAVSIDVDMDAYTTQEFTDVEMDLGDFTFFKVFLWADMSTSCAPLANYFES